MIVKLFKKYDEDDSMKIVTALKKDPKFKVYRSRTIESNVMVYDGVTIGSFDDLHVVIDIDLPEVKAIIESL